NEGLEEASLEPAAADVPDQEAGPERRRGEEQPVPRGSNEILRDVPGREVRDRDRGAGGNPQGQPAAHSDGRQPIAEESGRTGGIKFAGAVALAAGMPDQGTLPVVEANLLFNPIRYEDPSVSSRNREGSNGQHPLVLL